MTTFYRHIGALLSIRHTPLTQIFKNDISLEEIVRKVVRINDYFPFERKVTREIVYGNSLDYLSYAIEYDFGGSLLPNRGLQTRLLQKEWRDI
jgi:hypothetical protein